MHQFNIDELEYKIINVSQVQPSDLFGNANSFINHINKKFLQLKMFLTKTGRSAKFIATGDKTQIDLPAQIESGLKIALDPLNQTKGISIIEFNGGDNLRHPLLARIAEAFKN